MALERFIPKSPDMFIRNSQDFEVAKFGHLNTIVEYINNNTVQPAGLNGYVQFNDNNALGGDAGLFWDNVNKRLGVGTVTPIVPLNIYNNNAGISSVILVEQDTATTVGQINQYRKNGSVNLISGAEIGRISFGGYFNSTYSPFSQTCSVIYGYYGGTGTDRVGGLRLNTYNGGGLTTRLQVAPDGKVSIGTTAATAKLQIVGEGQTSGTTSLLVQNSLATQLFRVYDDGTTDVGPSLHFYPSGIIATDFGSLQLQGASRVQINNNEVLATADNFSWANNNFIPSNGTRNNFQFIGNGSSYTNVGAGGTSIGNVLKFNIGLATSIGDVTLNHINIDNTINTTAGTTFQRGFYYNPTLTGTVGFTHNAIQTVTGNVLLNTTSGNTLIGASPSNTAKLSIKGSGSTSATTSLLVQNSAGTQLAILNDAGNCIIGTGSPSTFRLEVTGTTRLNGLVTCDSNITLVAGNSVLSCGIIKIGNGSSTANIITDNIKPISMFPTTGVESFRLFENGNLLLQQGGTFSDVPSSKCTINSTTQGFLKPRMTTAEINAIVSPANGLEVYNTTLLQPCFYDGIAWRKVTHSTM
jgi:hypothetical protein